MAFAHSIFPRRSSNSSQFSAYDQLMDISGSQLVLVDCGFLRGPAIKAALKEIDYRGSDESFEEVCKTFESGDPTTAYPLYEEVLDVHHPYLLQMKLNGISERLSLAIPWQRVQGIVSVTEARKAEMGFRP